MLKYLSIFITSVITSFYYFPISFMAFPAINTKLILSVVGVILFVINSLKEHQVVAKSDYIALFVLSLVFSLICFFSSVFNNTVDYVYATYFISMFVWIFGAYTVCQLIKSVHGTISIELLANYLIVICVFQCFFALLIDNVPAFEKLIDSIIWQDQMFLKRIKRLYGIGAMLDTAGIRFSVVLVLIAYLLTIANDSSLRPYIPLYIFSFFVLATVGNMIARTTSVGVAISLIFLLYSRFFTQKNNFFSIRLFFYVISFLFVTVFILTYLYHTNLSIQKSLRFGFEGFFSLFEKGEWEVRSNTQLQSMLVFPDNLKTWIIGDGYFINPIHSDPYFVGKIIGGYYMGTDIGYCRFIFYCGIIGLFCLSIFMYRAAVLCAHRFPHATVLFYFLLLLHFLCWIKVSTDIFLIFALFIVMEKEDSNGNNEKITALG